MLWWLALAVVLLLQNYPNHILYTRSFMTVVRDTGADLRNALAARLQSLSIGYHTRVSSSIVQTKVVRDVENVELMLQQVTHPLLSAIMVHDRRARDDRDRGARVPAGLRARGADRDRHPLVAHAAIARPATRTSAARSRASRPASARWPRSSR